MVQVAYLQDVTIGKWPIFKIRSFFSKDKSCSRSCSNGVCCSWGIFFRWHFWHILFLVSNNLIMKNKVLSYHKLNSGKNSIAADYLHFPSHKNTNILFFSLLFLEFWWYFQFLECIATISKPMKIFKMRRCGIIKLSKLNITW